MEENKLIRPGKWSTEFDENGNELKITYDDSFWNLLGYKNEEEANKSRLNLWMSAVHPDDAKKQEGYFEQIVSKHPEGMDYDYEYHMMTKNGYRWFHDYGRVFRKEDGTPIRIDGVVFDIQDKVEKIDTHKLLAENYTRVLALKDSFEVLYDVELDTGRYDIFVKGQAFGDVNNNLINNNSFFEDVEKNLNVVQLTSNYDVVLKYGWGKKTIPGFDPMMFLNNEELSVMGNARINQMLYFYPVGCALVEFLPGVLADRLGRKKATSCFAIGSIVTYVLFYIGSMNAWNPYLLGFLIGSACGCVWSHGDLLLLMTSESVETNLRVSVNTAVYLFSGAFYGAGMGIFALCTLSGNDGLFVPITLAMAVVGLTIGTFFLFTRVKDTKDVDISTVKASDFN